MDAETKEYLDRWRAEILAAMNAGFSRLERRPEPRESGASLGELADRVVSLEERFRTMQLRMEQLEGWIDDLARDTRQRFPMLNDRVSGMERRLVAQERMGESRRA